MFGSYLILENFNYKIGNNFKIFRQPAKNLKIESEKQDEI